MSNSNHPHVQRNPSSVHPCPPTRLQIIFSCSLNKRAFLSSEWEKFRESQVHKGGKLTKSVAKNAFARVLAKAVAAFYSALTRPVCLREASSFIGIFHVSQRAL